MYRVYPDDVIAPSTNAAEGVKFQTLTVEQGVVKSNWFPAPGVFGFNLPLGIWHLSAQAHWGSSDPGYEKWAWLSGLTFSDVDGTNDMDLESSNVIPDNSNAYVNNISTLFRQSDSSPPIVGLSIKQFSGTNVTLSSAFLMCVKLRDL
jgi:hypothetical protein